MSNKPTIVIDPGHGGNSKIGGSSPNNAVGANGLLEKNLTLDMANRVAAKLASQADVFLTRAGDTNLGLSERAKFARDRNARIFLSLHFNGFGDTNVDGTEVWVAKQATQASKDFAKTILGKVVGATGLRDRGVRAGDLGVILPTRHAPDTSACLLEISFLSNPAQAKKLEGETYRQSIADSICEGVAQYLHSIGISKTMSDEWFDTKTMADATIDELAAELGYGSLSSYVSSVVKPATLFGQTVGGGLHPDFYKKLQNAEKEAALLIHPDGSPVTSAEWGVSNIGGCQPRRRGWHPWGLAIDVDYIRNPYVMHEAGEPKIDAMVAPVYHRIARLVLKRDSVIPSQITETKPGESKKNRVSRLYDALLEESTAMKTYFKAMQDQTLIQKELAKHDLLDIDFWKNVWGITDHTPPLDEIQQMMMSDYVALSGQSGPSIAGKTYPDPAVVYKGLKGDAPFVKRKPENGFLTIRKEIVTAITNNGLRWGAIDFGAPSGDVMHFDDGWGSFAGKITAAKKKLEAKSKGQSFGGDQFNYAGESFGTAVKPSVNRSFSELKDPPENHYNVRVTGVGEIRVTEGFLVSGPHSPKNGIRAILGDGSINTPADGSTINLGIDYVVKDEKNRVANWFDGQVSSTISSNQGYGNRVIVKTDLTYTYEKKEYPVYTHYAHLDSISVKKGDRLKNGDFVGVMGNTGASHGAHVDQRFWIDSDSGKIDLSPNLLVTLVSSGLKYAEPYGGKTYTASDAKWAADNVSPDYRHLGQPIDYTPFDFSATNLERLAEVNFFNVNTNEKDPRDEVLFGLRGCQIADGKESSGGFVSSVKLVEAIPDHQQSKCVIGVWKRSTKQIAVFLGSTVPYWKGMVKQVNDPAGEHCNLLPTGCYRYTVNTHRGSEAEYAIYGAFIQQKDVVVLRTEDDLIYEISDEWDVAGSPMDNIHPSRHPKPTDAFSSEGCVTVPGGGTFMTRKDKINGLWSEFRKSAGLTATEAPEKEDGRKFKFILLTGREARLSNNSNWRSLARLRFGSVGVDVEALQLGLANLGKKHYGGTIDGDMQMSTVKAFINWQKDSFGVADGIVTNTQANNLGFDFIKHQSIPPTPVKTGASQTQAAPPAIRKLTDAEIEYYKKIDKTQNWTDSKGKKAVNNIWKDAVVWELPEKGEGFINYNRNDKISKPAGYNDDYYLDEIGTKETIEKIIAIAKEWHKTHSDQPLQIGDISRPGGIDTPDHSGHMKGTEFDMRPLRTKNGSGPLKHTSADYSLDLTKEFIRLVRRLYPSATFYFNDDDIYKKDEFKGFVSWESGHDDHLHVMF